MELELHIDSLSYGGGRGVGRHQGMVVFVPFAAPGDHLRVRVTQQKKNLLEAEIIEVLKPSELRRTPPCPVFGVCGGCTWQHVAYSTQLEQKQLFIERALRDLPISVSPIVGSPQEFHYRNRIQLHRRGAEIGFLKRGSDQMVPVDHCWIADEAINREISLGNLWSKSSSPRFELALTTENQVILREAGQQNEESLFSQVNAEQNQALIEIVTRWAKELHARHRFSDFYDLFSGAGNLTFPLFKKLRIPGVGVELSSGSVQLARKTLRGEPLSFEAEDVQKFLVRFSSPLKMSLVVLDPPREGLNQVIVDRLGMLKPQGLILVGCHLMNFARDLKRLQAKGFRILKIQPLDMFPQTDHVEVVAQMEWSAH